MVMLQMAEKTTKTKRRALLMMQNEPAAAPTTSQVLEHADEPQPLPGDAFDRMRMDPEIKQFQRRLMIGAAVVGLIVVLMVLWSLVPSNAKPVNPPGPQQAHQDKAPPPPQAAMSMIPPEDSLQQVNSGNLVFRPPAKMNSPPPPPCPPSLAETWPSWPLPRRS